MGLRSKKKMVGIPEDNIRIYLLSKLALMHALYRCYGTHRHKNGGFYNTMIGDHSAGTGFAFWIRMMKGELQILNSGGKYTPIRSVESVKGVLKWVLDVRD